MWVLAGGMFRSGSTLQYQIVSEMIERSGMGTRCGWMMPEEFGDYAESAELDPNQYGAMRVFKTHVCKHPMRVRLRDGRALGVACYRDLRDVVVSGSQKAGVAPDAEYARQLITGCLACYNGWPVCPSLKWWSYERLTLETAAVTLEMCEHLRIPCDRDAAGEVSDMFSPVQQQRRIERSRAGSQCEASDSSIGFLEHDLLHHNHLHDGRTGKWREHLPPETLSVIHEIAGPWLQTHGYTTPDEHLAREER